MPWLGVLFLLLSLLLLSAVQAQGRSNSKRNVRQELSRVQQLIDRAQFATAAKILKRLTRRYPNNKVSYYLLGRIYYRAGKPKQAGVDLEVSRRQRAGVLRRCFEGQEGQDAAGSSRARVNCGWQSAGQQCAVARDGHRRLEWRHPRH